ncbi:adenosine deaminase [Halobacteriales archaeon QS_9_68_17]|nr:MAG: adenosine deaminase [Halobacteriales archaeon QS_9_68_17]
MSQATKVVVGTVAVSALLAVVLVAQSLLVA